MTRGASTYESAGGMDASIRDSDSQRFVQHVERGQRSELLSEVSRRLRGLQPAAFGQVDRRKSALGRQRLHLSRMPYVQGRCTPGAYKHLKVRNCGRQRACVAWPHKEMVLSGGMLR